MRTLGELFDALTELAKVTAVVHDTSTAMSRGCDDKTLEGKRQDLWRARDQMDKLRARALTEDALNHHQRSLFGE